jgi:hypothetical protein
LSDSAKTYIGHYADAKRIIFKTAAGLEIPFQVTRKDQNARYSGSITCDVDTSMQQGKSGTAQVQVVSLLNDAVLNDTLNIFLVSFPALNDQDPYEYLAVYLGAYPGSAFQPGNDLLYFSLQDKNSWVSFADSLVLGGKTFYGVYEAKQFSTAPNLIVKYSKQQGIIYIKNPNTSKEYIYDRKE